MKRLIIRFENGAELDTINPPKHIDDDTIGRYISDAIPWDSADYFVKHYYGDIYLEAIKLIDKSRRGNGN